MTGSPPARHCCRWLVRGVAVGCRRFQRSASRASFASEDVFYYITLMNESYPQPTLPTGNEEAIVRGMYRHSHHHSGKPAGKVRLLGSGAILAEVIAAAEMLAADWRVEAEVWSVTSFT